MNDYREILKYAEERHVEVIPEFDMPGHGHAAIKAMQARQRKQAAMGNSFKADQYLLSDPLDASKYLSVQFFTDNAINPCLESTYEFVEHIVVSVKYMHQDIQPLKVTLRERGERGAGRGRVGRFVAYVSDRFFILIKLSLRNH